MDHNITFLADLENVDFLRGNKVLLRAHLGTRFRTPNSLEGLVKSACFLQHRGAHTVMYSDSNETTEEVISLLRTEFGKCYMRFMVEEDRTGEEAAAKLSSPSLPYEVVYLQHLDQYEAKYKSGVAAGAVLFVDDSLASDITEVARGVPRRCAGFQLGKELDLLAELRSAPQKPYVALVAGRLLSEKVSLLYALLEKTDKLQIAGDMADTFYRAQGHQIGTAATEPDMIPLAQEILEAAEQRSVAVHLATDARILPSEVAAARLSELVHSVSDTSQDRSQHAPPRGAGTPLNLDYAHKAIQLGVKRVPLSLSSTPAGPLFKPVADSTRIVPVMSIPSGWMAVDAGPDTLATFCGALTDAATVLWTGNLGKCVQGEYADSTRAIAKYLSQLTAEKKVRTFACGAETVAALNWELKHPRAESTSGKMRDVGGDASGGGDGRPDPALATGTERARDEDAAGVHDGVGLEFTHVFSGGDAALKLLEGKLPASVDRLVSED